MNCRAENFRAFDTKAPVSSDIPDFFPTAVILDFPRASATAKIWAENIGVNLMKISINEKEIEIYADMISLMFHLLISNLMQNTVLASFFLRRYIIIDFILYIVNVLFFFCPLSGCVLLAVVTPKTFSIKRFKSCH